MNIGKRVLVCLSIWMTGLSGMAGNPVFSGAGLEFEFASPEQGLGCVLIRDMKHDREFFDVRGKPGEALLWGVTLSHPGGVESACRLTNIEARQYAACQETADGLVMRWTAVPLSDDGGTLDVEVTIRNVPDRGRVIWNLSAKLNSGKYTFLSTQFPDLKNAVDIGHQSILFPRGNYGSQYIKRPMIAWYPACYAQLQMTAFLEDDRPGGIYLGVEDANAATKCFEYDKDGAFLCNVLADDTGISGRSEPVAYDVSFAAAADAWDAARIYRDWALQQKWAAKGPMRERTELPETFRYLTFWLRMYLEAKDMEPRLNEQLKRRNYPIGIHWYIWSEHKYDNDYPNFLPPKGDFRKVIRRAVARGNIIMPYINGRLWDTHNADYQTEGVQSEVKKDFNGTPIREDYGSGTVLVASCPASPIYRERIRAAVRALTRDEGCNAVYIDQIAASEANACYSSAHGHRPGGGGWWSQAYREMFAPLLQENPALIIASENGAEPYMDSISAFLLWGAQYGKDFPSLPVVYSTHTRYFGVDSEPQDSLKSFVVAQRRSALWGIQPGWLSWLQGETMETSDRNAKLAYMDILETVWRAGVRFYADGELLRDVDFPDGNPEMKVFMPLNLVHRLSDGNEVEPYYRGSVWRSYDKQALWVVLSSIADQPAMVRWSIPAELLDHPIRSIVDPVTGAHVPFEAHDDRITAVIQLPVNGLRGLLLQ